jgi:ABC-2 type transport system ATP-binding protein
MPDALLEIENLHYAYGPRQAIAGVALACRRGEVLGLLGPNGAGKSTLVACIAGLLGAWRGAMRLDGAPFRPHGSAADRARIGLVPQDLALYDELSGRENLAFFARAQGVAAADVGARVRQGLELAGLADRAGDRVATYSGGMKRRLNLAAGDLHAPDLLLLDEPTVGVDPQSRNHVFECLRQLQREGRTLVYTTHYMEEAQRLCDRVAIMHEGRVLDVGTPAELAARAGTPGADLESVFLHLTGRSLRDGDA